MKKVKTEVILYLLGVFIMVTFLSSMGVNQLLLALKWNITATLPAAIALIIVPIISGIVLTYVILREFGGDSDEQKSEKKSNF